MQRAFHCFLKDHALDRHCRRKLIYQIASKQRRVRLLGGFASWRALYCMVIEKRVSTGSSLVHRRRAHSPRPIRMSTRLCKCIANGTETDRTVHVHKRHGDNASTLTSAVYASISARSECKSTSVPRKNRVRLTTFQPMKTAMTMKIIPSVTQTCQLCTAIPTEELTLENEEICLEGARIEKGVSRDDENAKRHDECVPSCVWLQSRTVWEEDLSVKTLSLHGIVEAEPSC